jgi:chromosome segregation ATPase
LHGENESLQREITQLKTDNKSLSNRLTATGDSKSLSSNQLNELLKLRGEVGGLRTQASQLDRLRKENERLQTALHNANSQPVPVDAQEQELQASRAKMDDAKQGMLAFIMFAVDNQQQFPTNFDQASHYLPGDYRQQVETNFDIAYQGSISGITNPASTIVLKEKQAWQASSGKWFKAYGFADGHAELHSEPNGDFEDWESQHTVLPAPNQ